MASDSRLETTRIEIIEAVVDYLSPELIEQLRQRVDTTTNFADLRGMLVATRQAATRFKDLLEPEFVPDEIMPDTLELEQHHLFLCDDTTPSKPGKTERVQDDRCKLVVQLRALEDELGLHRFDLGRLRRAEDLWVIRERVNHLLTTKARRSTGVEDPTQFCCVSSIKEHL